MFVLEQTVSTATYGAAMFESIAIIAVILAIALALVLILAAR